MCTLPSSSGVFVFSLQCSTTKKENTTVERRTRTVNQHTAQGSCVVHETNPDHVKRPRA